MKDPAFQPIHLSRLAATIDSGSLPSEESHEGRCKVELVEGSGPELSFETHRLLRSRLRAAALIMLAGFSTFWVYDFFQSIQSTRPHVSLLLGLHSGVNIVLAVCATILFRICPKSLRMLRITELVTFSVPAAFFVVMQYLAIMSNEPKTFWQSPAAPWLLLVFIYAVFIPNGWRRAALVVGLIAAIPVLLSIVVRLLSPVVAAGMPLDDLIHLTLLMALGAVSAVYGTSLIGSLRREAFEAKQLGQYRLRKLIGRGGMGEVYLAEHQLLKRPCAIKLIRPGRAADPHALARFEREVRMTAQLSHWNTVEIFDYGHTEDGTFYYVMEYLPGLSLDELVEQYGPLGPARAVHLLRQVCDGLREAHASGFIHRDIKPGNIIAAERGGIYDVAKLLDFGLVKPLVDDGQQLTIDGGLTGSPLFISPEQALGDSEPDARSDIYSLGATGYFLLTGRPPFERERTLQLLIAHAHDEVRPPSQHRPDLPADLEQVILRALAKQPADRFSDVESLDRALSECDANGQWTRHDAARWWQSREEPVAAAAG